MKIREIPAKSILSKSGIYGVDFVINPYLGCGHGCRYCYADFMKKFHKGKDEWGDFVNVKINAPEVLRKEQEKINKGKIMISSVCDPYQPVENKYEITRKCLIELLNVDADKNLEISILTKSPLVLRDIDLLKKFRKIEIGLTITTDDDNIRRIFEPNAPAIESRIEALKKMHEEGLRTYAFIGPILPMDAAKLIEKLSNTVDSVFVDRMNYIWKTQKIYIENNFQYAMEDEFFEEKKKELLKKLKELKIPAIVLF